MSPKNKRGGAKRPTTKRDVAIAFVAFFTVFFVVGYLRGRSDRNSPDRLKIYLGEIIRKDNNLLRMGKNAGGKRVFTYACPGNHYSFEVDTDKVHKDPLAARSTTAEFPELAITNDSAFYSAFVVGTISAWSIKDVFAWVAFSETGGSAASRAKVIIAAIAGTVVGYELGYWLATRTPPSCDFAKYDELLQDPKQWESIEAATWLERFRKINEANSGFSSCGAEDVNVRRVQDEKLSNALTKFEELKDRVSEVGHNFSSADFDSLDEFANVKAEYIKLCFNQSAAPN